MNRSPKQSHEDKLIEFVFQEKSLSMFIFQLHWNSDLYYI